MITEDYVSFEVASLLKDKGFPQKMKNSGYFATEMVYGITELEDGTHHLCHQYPACYDFDNHICAPTLQMAMKWLREVHNLVIQIELIDFLEHGEVWLYCVIDRKTIKQLTGRDEDFTEHSYEAACEAAIKYCLETLI